jgi:hypothetical protein
MSFKINLKTQLACFKKYQIWVKIFYFYLFNDILIYNFFNFLNYFNK